MKKRLIRIAVIVAVILIIPLFGEFLVEGWNWGVQGFAAAFIYLFVAGLLIDLAARKVQRPLLRFLVIAAIVLGFMAVWATLATDGGVWLRLRALL